MPGDWYPGVIPPNVEIVEGAYVETSYSFRECRSEMRPAVTLGRGSGIYTGVMLDVGPAGRVTVGDYSTVVGGRLICDAEIAIGSYCLISWNVVIMDTYRLPVDPTARRALLEHVARTADRILPAAFASPRPVHVDDNVWIGFDACILPGVHIGTGSVVAAKSVVVADVPPYSVVGGNPARILRTLAA